MAFKMKGAPLMDTSKKHGTNKNFMKSGMKNADGSSAAGAPFLGGIGKKLLDPLGLFGKGKGKGGACPPGQMQPPVPRPAEPTGTPAPAAAAPAPAAPAAEEAQPAATMKIGLMKGGAPKLKGGQHKIDMNKDGKLSKADFDMMNKKGAPMAKKGGPKMMAKKKGAPMAKKEGAPLKGILRKGDKMVKDLGDKYSKSSLGKAMGKADKFIANLGKKKK